MKTAPIYMTRKMLVRKFNKRNARIASEHVSISNDLPQHSVDFLNRFRMSLAKFAHRNRCRLSFVKGEEGTQMNVEREQMHLYYLDDIPASYKTCQKEGIVSLPDGKEPENLFSVIKSGVISILKRVNN